MTRSRKAKTQPWYEVLDELRGETSQDDIAHEARKFGAPSTLSGANLSRMKPGAAHPMPYRHKPEIFEGLAGALGVEPTVFAEYRLAMARRLFDEQEQGLDQAAANLEAAAEGMEALLEREAGLSVRAAPPDGREGRRSPGSGQRKRKSA